jgi:hypothetical protein
MPVHGSLTKAPSLAIANRQPESAAPSSAFLRAAWSCVPWRGISRVKVPKASVSKLSTWMSRHPIAGSSNGARSISFPWRVRKATEPLFNASGSALAAYRGQAEFLFGAMSIPVNDVYRAGLHQLGITLGPLRL